MPSFAEHRGVDAKDLTHGDQKKTGMQTGGVGWSNLKTFCSLLCCTAITPAKTARSTAIQKGTKASRANTTSNPAFQTHSLQPPPCFLSSSFLPATFLQTLYASCCVACDRETCPGHIQHSQRMMAQGDDSGFRQTLPPFQGLCPSPGQGCR